GHQVLASWLLHHALIRTTRGHGEFEGGAGTGLRLYPDPPAIVLDDLLADGQADPTARVFGTRVQTAEDDKNVFRVLGRDSDSVIAHVEPPLLIGLFSLHGNHRRLLAAELDGIPDLILEDLPHVGAVSPHGRKLRMGDDRSTLLNRRGQS